MNNLNDPMWNIQPDLRGREAGAGDGNQWNYTPLVCMLGLAAFRWIWARESQKELEKERQKAQEVLKEEKKKWMTSGVSAALRDALERENNWYQRATATLKVLEGQLVHRQYIYCSYTQRQEQRLEMERNILNRFVKDPIGAQLNLESDLRDIFKRDTHCAELLNTVKTKNGSLMWVYLKYWDLKITMQKHIRAEKAILEGKIWNCTK